ncbi:S24 family peptidase [Pararhizobium sp.]|uniref:S24 family peptidase n=1 Tax=Pararhizobium sp. TaxID=1977563 RepID=UPI00271F80AA|nr:S24 family peptidase [Pararhizobium sp.]MDO9416997.1 S24 family peptidase [Pararhizobium sp.]
MLREILTRIESRLGAVELSAAAASAKAGLSKDAIRNIKRAIEDGKEEAGTSTSTIIKLAPVLGTTASWLLEGMGMEAGVEVPLWGYIGAGAEIDPDFEQIPADGLEQIVVPFPLPDEMVAFEIKGDSMLPVYKPGSVIICYREQKRPLTAFYGEEAAVRTSDNRRFLKTISRGVGGVNLMSFNAPLIEGVHLEWIGEIFAVLPKNKVHRVELAGGIQGRLRMGA